jgi:hypothetical protein
MRNENNNYNKRINFDNGYTLSIACNMMSYGSADGLFEVALIDNDGNFIYDAPGFENGCRGYLDFQQVASVIEEVRQFKNRKDHSVSCNGQS